MLSLVAPLTGCLEEEPMSDSTYVTYVGTHTRNKSDGIYAYRFDTSTGEAESLGLLAENT